MAALTDAGGQRRGGVESRRAGGPVALVAHLREEGIRGAGAGEHHRPAAGVGHRGLVGHREGSIEIAGIGGDLWKIKREKEIRISLHLIKCSPSYTRIHFSWCEIADCATVETQFQSVVPMFNCQRPDLYPSQAGESGAHLPRVLPLDHSDIWTELKISVHAIVKAQG